MVDFLHKYEANCIDLHMKSEKLQERAQIDMVYI